MTGSCGATARRICRPRSRPTCRWPRGTASRPARIRTRARFGGAEGIRQRHARPRGDATQLGRRVARRGRRPRAGFSLHVPHALAAVRGTPWSSSPCCRWASAPTWSSSCCSKAWRSLRFRGRRARHAWACSWRVQRRAAFFRCRTWIFASSREHARTLHDFAGTSMDGLQSRPRDARRAGLRRDGDRQLLPGAGHSRQSRPHAGAVGRRCARAGHPVAVISDALWRRVFGARSGDCRPDRSDQRPSVHHRRRRRARLRGHDRQPADGSVRAGDDAARSFARAGSAVDPPGPAALGAGAPPAAGLVEHRGGGRGRNCCRRGSMPRGRRDRSLSAPP